MIIYDYQIALVSPQRIKRLRYLSCISGQNASIDPFSLEGTIGMTSTISIGHSAISLRDIFIEANSFFQISFAFLYRFWRIDPATKTSQQLFLNQCKWGYLSTGTLDYIAVGQNPILQHLSYLAFKCLAYNFSSKPIFLYKRLTIAIGRSFIIHQKE